MNQDNNNPTVPTPATAPSAKALTRRGFVARLQTAAVITPLAVAAIATLPKVRAGS